MDLEVTDSLVAQGSDFKNQQLNVTERGHYFLGVGSPQEANHGVLAPKKPPNPRSIFWILFDSRNFK